MNTTQQKVLIQAFNEYYDKFVNSNFDPDNYGDIFQKNQLIIKMKKIIKMLDDNFDKTNYDTAFLKSLVNKL